MVSVQLVDFLAIGGLGFLIIKVGVGYLFNDALQTLLELTLIFGTGYQLSNEAMKWLPEKTKDELVFSWCLGRQEDEINKIQMLFNQAKITTDSRSATRTIIRYVFRMMPASQPSSYQRDTSLTDSSLKFSIDPIFRYVYTTVPF